MRVIKVEVVGRYESDLRQPGLSLDMPERMLVKELRVLDRQISELIRQRAAACLSRDRPIFVRTHLEPNAARTVTDLWIIEPKVRGPFGLLTRMAWKVLAPMVAHVVRELFAARFGSLALDVDPRLTKVTGLTPMRIWRDPFILSVMTILLTSVVWLFQ